MQMMKLFNSVLAVTSLVMAVPVALNSNHTRASLSTAADRALATSGSSHSSAILGDGHTNDNNNDNDNNNNNEFRLFGMSSTGPFQNTTVLDRAVIDEEGPTLQEHHTIDRMNLAVTADAEQGRPGKIPYKKFPPCYMKCFDSEGIDSKTSPTIGDIRDLTTFEFCDPNRREVIIWVHEHFGWCAVGECKSCGINCHHDAGKTFYDLCGRSFWSIDK